MNEPVRLSEKRPRTEAGQALYDSVRVYNVVQRRRADDEHDAKWLAAIRAIEAEAAADVIAGIALRSPETPEAAPRRVLAKYPDADGESHPLAAWVDPATLLAPETPEAAPALDVEALRVATWRLSNAAASLARHARHVDDPAHRAWLPSSSGDVEREVGLARSAAGAEPSPAEYARLASERGAKPAMTDG